MDYTIVTCRATWMPLSFWAALLIFLGAGLPHGNSLATAQEDFQSNSKRAPRALPLPSRTGNSESDNGRARTISSSNSLLSTTISLGLIVGTLFLVGRWMKRNGFQGSAALPVEAFELLGRRQIEPKVAVHLVKCGNRILVLGVGADGIRTLSEICDPSEIQQLTDACQSSPKDESRTATSDRTKSTSSTPVSPAAKRLFVAVVAVGLLFTSVSPVQAQANRGGVPVARNREFEDAGAARRRAPYNPPRLTMRSLPVIRNSCYLRNNWDFRSRCWR